MIEVRAAGPADVEGAVAVLAALPGFFTPDTHEELRHSWSDDRAWVAVEGDAGVIGFVSVRRRHPKSAEITFAAVLADRQGTGVGTRLVDAALGALASDGVVLVEVKTLDASAPYEPYVATRAFWAARGFHQIDCIDPLPGWGPGNPAAILVAALRPTR
jgi:ribosomal protein S18 acetylase RimI-like enzyme